MLNKVTLIGNLGAEPDIHYSSDNRTIVNIRLATSSKWKDRNTGEAKEQTEWHRIVFFNKLADIAKQYFHKGQQIYIEGRLQTKKWQDKDNQDRYTTEIVAENMQMLGKKKNNNQPDFKKLKILNNITSINDSFMDDIPF